MKSIYRTILAVAGSFLAAQFGGWAGNAGLLHGN